MNDLYILRDGQPVPAPDLDTWSEFMKCSDQRRVVVTGLRDPNGDSVWVSTVFLGIDHAFLGGPAVLWETQVFGGPLDEEQQRYTSREAALKGHEEMVRRVKSPIAKEGSNLPIAEKH